MSSVPPAPAPDPDPDLDPGPSLPPSQANALLKAFTDFLTLALHSLLHHRRLYPPHTFLAVRAFNIAVHQSRHPGVCAWVADAVAAVAAQLRRGAVERAALAVHGPGQTLDVLERWVFDVGDFPVWGPDTTREREADEVPAGNGSEAPNEDEDGLNWSDVYEALRGALRRIAYAAEAMPLPPEGSTFTLAIELRDDALAPIGVRNNNPSLTEHAPYESLTSFCAASSTVDTIRAQPPASHPFPSQEGRIPRRRHDEACARRSGRAALFRVLGRAGQASKGDAGHSGAVSRTDGHDFSGQRGSLMTHVRAMLFLAPPHFGHKVPHWLLLMTWWHTSLRPRVTALLYRSLYRPRSHQDPKRQQNPFR